jgi:hypothetical protein
MSILAKLPLGLPRSPVGRAGLVAAGLALVLLGWRLSSGPGEAELVSAAVFEQALPARPAALAAQSASRSVQPAPGPVPGPVPGKDPITPATADLALVEASPDGPLPRIGTDGRRPLAAYARPQPPVPDRPQVAILVRGLGLQIDATNAAINLPGTISLQFSPYSDDLPGLFDRARLAGHEVLLDLPMQPTDYPASDLGPQTLLAAAAPADNQARLRQILVRAPGYIGLAGEGGPFAQSPSAEPVLQILAERGLGLVEIGSDGLAPIAARLGLPYVASAAVIDREPSAGTIDLALVALEQTAKAKGSALGVAEPYPISLARLTEWIASLEARGLTLVPVSQLLLAQAGTGAKAARLVQSGD